MRKVLLWERVQVLKSMQSKQKVLADDGPQALVVQVIPPRSAGSRDMAGFETALQALALDEHHPIALELAGTAKARLFLLRATSPESLHHLTQQIQAHYPQAQLQALAYEDDPLTIKPGESNAVVELQPGAASYLPMRSWQEREMLKEGADPLLGLLAALGHLPASTRAIVQLALVPLPATWSKADQRKAVEHPLETERMRQRQELTSSGISAPSTPAIVGLAVLVGILLLSREYARRINALLPRWMQQAALQALRGQRPTLTPWELTLLLTGSASVAVFCLLLLLLLKRIRRRIGVGGTPIYDMRLVAEKTGRLAYRARLRIFVIGTAEPGVQQQHLTRSQMVVLAELTAAYKQYHRASGGYFLPRHLSSGQAQRLLLRSTGGSCCGHFSRPPLFSRLFIFRGGGRGWTAHLRRSPHILSVADVAALWHLPQEQDIADLSLLERGRARTLLVPASLTTAKGWKIGTSVHAGYRLPVSLPAQCLRQNLLAVASTGKGKSTLFLHLAHAVLSLPETAQDALVIVDPHGDGVSTLLGLIPVARQKDVMLLDLADHHFPPGINPLDMAQGRTRDKAVDNLITIFEHIWSNSWGPRTENVLEYALKTLCDANETLVQADLQQGPDQQYTLLDVVPLLRSTSFRHLVLSQVHDDALLTWWRQYYEPMDYRYQLEVAGSVINKMSKFASSRLTRRIVGQSRSTLDLTEIVRQGKILLVSTASGVVGADIASLVGATVLGLLHSTLAEQAQVEVGKRRHAYTLIDEFQSISGANYQAMLSELRKFGGSFALATQSLDYLDKLDRTLRPTVLANIDHCIGFKMSAADAKVMATTLGVVTEDDLLNLDDFQCYAQFSLDGKRVPVFSLALDAPPSGNTDQATTIRLQSQQRYACAAENVDAMLARASARHVPAHLEYHESSNNDSNGKSEKSEKSRNARTLSDDQDGKEEKHTGGQDEFRMMQTRRHKHRGSAGKKTSSTQQTQEGPSMSTSPRMPIPLLFDATPREERKDVGLVE